MNPDQMLALLRLVASLEAERERLARRVVELEQAMTPMRTE